MNRPLFSIIIPTYNEAQNIALLIEKISKVLEHISHEIMIIDDNSPDRTWEIAQGFCRQYPQVRVIRRINERGLGSAVTTGMAAAQGDIFAVMDADMQHDENILPQLFESVKQKGYDIAVASRRLNAGDYGEFSFLRKILSQGAALTARLVLRMSIKDSMSGFFALSRKLYQDKIDKINPLGFKILIEFLGHSPEAKVIEIPYTFKRRIYGETKLSAGVVRHFFIALWNLRFGRFISATFMLYAGVGLIGILVNLLGFAWGEFLEVPRVHTGILPGLDPIWLSIPFGIQLSIISNYVLNNYITFYEHRRRGFFPHLRGFSLFQLISLLGVLIQWSIFQVLYANHFLNGLASIGLSKYIYNIIGILMATASNYYLNLSYTWRKT